MKARKSTLLLFTILTLIFNSCKHDIFTISSTSLTEKQNVSEGKVLLSINLHSEYSRTALPIIDWDDFTYELIAVQNPGEATQKPAVTLFSARSKTDLVVGVPLDAGKYKFTLNAYKNSKKVLSGDEIADLTQGSKSLFFKMYPVSTGKGNAKVKVRYPKDNPVSKIVAYVSTNIFEEQAGTELPSTMVSGKWETTFEPANLPSNTEQYAIFRFYDNNGALVYFGAESLIIIGDCTSESLIDLTEDDWHTYACTVTLKKDGDGWTSSGKTVTLVNKTDNKKVYSLADSAGGKFKASVAEGIYYVYVNGENTGVEFNSINKNIDINYYTVAMDSVRNCTMIPVSGGLDMADFIAIVQEGNTFTYQIKLSDGYETTSGLTVKQNEVPVENAAFDTNIVIEAVTASTKVKAEGITPIVYTITYSDNGVDFAAGKTSQIAYWYKYNSTYVPPVEFTAEDTVILPAIENIRKDNNYFDVWTDSEGKTVIDTNGIFHNLVLNATWKSAPKVDDVNGIIYANGFNLLINSSDAKNTATNIFIDYNGNGIKEGDDTQITCNNIATTKTNDFTGYELRAGSDDGSYVPKSDFTITMTGGKIAAIYGLNSPEQKYSNKSTLKISGTAQIGSIEGQKIIKNPDSTTTTVADSVKGIMLDTLSSERVFIVNQMTNPTAQSPYAVTCVTTKEYDREEDHIVAEIVNSNYASLANFTCWNVSVDEEDSTKKKYAQLILTNRETLVNSVERTYIQMADNSGVILPKADELAWDLVKNEFSFDAEVVNQPSSVFSLAVENGSFRVNERTTITNNKNDAEQLIESTLTYMAQPTPITYVEELKFDENYVYMQVFSAGDLLTPLVINDFLSQICFKKNNEDEKMKVTLNIETVPSKDIRGDGDGFGGPEYKYFNGSFYKRYYQGNDTADGYNTVTLQKGLDKGKKVGLIKWSSSYNKAKQKSFNGLKGYLMNITSEVENNYIYDTYFKLYPNQLSWAGGGAVEPILTMPGMLSGQTVSCWDQDTTNLIDNANVATATALNSKKNTNKWYWQAGPEAGMCFWGTAVIENETDVVNGYAGSDCNFERWNNSEFLHNGDIYDENQNFDDEVAPGVLLRGRLCKEPNGKMTHRINGVDFTGTKEQYLQFLAGELDTDSGNYRANGFWNNQGDSNTQTDGFGCTGYIVEFTPYQTEYGKQIANHHSIKRSGEY